MEKNDALGIFRSKNVAETNLEHGPEIPEITLQPGETFQWCRVEGDDIFWYTLSNFDEEGREKYRNKGWEASIFVKYHRPKTKDEPILEELGHEGAIPYSGFIGDSLRREVNSAGVIITLTSQPGDAVLKAKIKLADPPKQELPQLSDGRTTTANNVFELNILGPVDPGQRN